MSHEQDGAGDGAGAGGEADGSPEPSLGTSATTWTQVWSVLGTVVAPATMVSALLLYFGYVSARAQFAYFGVDVDTLGYSTQEYVMRAPQPLLVPSLVLLIGGAAMIWVNGRIHERMRTASPRSVHRALAGTRVGAVVLLAGGLVMLLAYPSIGSWDFYPLITPLVLGLGAGLLVLSASWQTRARGRGRAAAVLLVLVVVATSFWATATLAQWSGTGQAKSLARDLTALPAVVIDTPQSLAPRDATVVETMLPAEEGQTYRYRYRGLRLLAEGDGRLFLVPETWSSAGSTFVVNFDGVRVRFRFIDDAP